MNTRRLMTCLTTMTLLAATLAGSALALDLPKTNGVYTAQVGAQCVPQPVAWADHLPFSWAAHSPSDVKTANQMLLVHDYDAWMKMNRVERIILPEQGQTLFVVERLPNFTIIEGISTFTIKVRPQGELFELWMNDVYVDCSAIATKITKTTTGAR
jgi:hypothetical protein